MKKKLLKHITSISLLSRIYVILLQFIFNLLIPDHQSDGFISPAVNIKRESFDDTVLWILGGFFRWDAQYFLNISIYGYVYENSLAFFPFFPICIRTVANILNFFLNDYLNITSVHLVSSVIVNVIAFVLATRSLFHLTCKILKDEKLAFIASALFCVNPASIFFTAPYSEALFAFFTFQAMLNDDSWTSSIYVALSSSVRSNGIVNLGFPIYCEVRKFVNGSINFRTILSFVCKIFFIFSVSLSTFIAYQIYSRKSFCNLYSYQFDENVRKFGEKNSLILRGQNVTKICDVWLPYFYVQKQYWDIGYLHYFKLNQLPNFALAFPIIYFSISQSLIYLRQNTNLIFSLGLVRSTRNNIRICFFPYCIHLIFLVVVCLFFVHIQITTRFLCSASPAIYWFGASLFQSDTKSLRRRVPFFGFPFTLSPLTFYCFSYFIIGTALFSNFYPWT